MRVLFVINRLYCGGGVERMRIRLLHYFSARPDFDISVVVTGEETPMMVPLPEGLEVQYLNQDSVRKTLFMLRDIFKKRRPDIIFSAQTHLNIVAILANLFAGRKAKIVCTEHRNISETVRHGTLPFRAKFYLTAKAAGILYQFADRISFVSKGIMEDGRKVFHLSPKNSGCIYNSVNIEEIQKDMQEPVDHPWLRQKDVPVLVFVGRLSVQKGLVYLLEAVKTIRGQRPVRLLIIGEGEDLEMLREKCRSFNIENHVDFLGFQMNPHKFMSGCDVFVLPSLYEGFANIIIESMASGLPVVSTDCPSGPSEIISEGENGLLVKPADPDQLAEAILKVLNNPDLARKFSEAGKERVRDFHLNKIGAEYEKLFRTVMNG